MQINLHTPVLYAYLSHGLQGLTTKPRFLGVKHIRRLLIYSDNCDQVMCVLCVCIIVKHKCVTGKTPSPNVTYSKVNM